MPFFTEEKLKQLIKFIMEKPAVTEKKSYRYPQVAAQLLESGNKIVLAFFEAREE